MITSKALTSTRSHERNISLLLDSAISLIAPVAWFALVGGTVWHDDRSSETAPIPSSSRDKRFRAVLDKVPNVEPEEHHHI